jgi:hypothetical protein
LDLAHDPVGVTQNVPSRESEEADARVEQPILAPVVVRKSVPVSTSVIFDAESLSLVEEIRTADEPAPSVVNGNLGLRTRKAAKNKKHSESRFHWRLRSRLDQVEHTPKVLNPTAPGVGACPRGQTFELDATVVQCLVGDDHGLDEA